MCVAAVETIVTTHAPIGYVAYTVLEKKDRVMRLNIT